MCELPVQETGGLCPAGVNQSLQGPDIGTAEGEGVPQPKQDIPYSRVSLGTSLEKPITGKRRPCEAPGAPPRLPPVL